MVHVLPSLLRAIRYRVMLLVSLGQWDDVARVLDHAWSVLTEDDQPPNVLEEIGHLILLVVRLAPPFQEAVVANLGEWEAPMREWIEEQG